MPVQTERQHNSVHYPPERVAYWYFRLNGFLQIENFVVHPRGSGSQRTDADLLGVRFRHRKEFLFDRPEPMADDQRLLPTPDLDNIVIVEVKTNQSCTLNGPWTKPERQNVHRVLAAIGCIPTEEIEHVATSIYHDGVAICGERRIRLVAVGRDRDPDLQERYHGVLQVTWNEVIAFIWDRFRTYGPQKRQSDQWDDCGKFLRDEATMTSQHDFHNTACRAMGVRLSRSA